MHTFTMRICKLNWNCVGLNEKIRITKLTYHDLGWFGLSTNKCAFTIYDYMERLRFIQYRLDIQTKEFNDLDY